MLPELSRNIHKYTIFKLNYNNLKVLYIDKFNVKNENPQGRAFSICKACRIKNGSEQPLPIKKL